MTGRDCRRICDSSAVGLLEDLPAPCCCDTALRAVVLLAEVRLGVLSWCGEILRSMKRSANICRCLGCPPSRPGLGFAALAPRPSLRKRSRTPSTLVDNAAPPPPTSTHAASTSAHLSLPPATRSCLRISGSSFPPTRHP